MKFQNEVAAVAGFYFRPHQGGAAVWRILLFETLLQRKLSRRLGLVYIQIIVRILMMTFPFLSPQANGIHILCRKPGQGCASYGAPVKYDSLQSDGCFRIYKAANCKGEYKEVPKGTNLPTVASFGGFNNIWSVQLCQDAKNATTK